MIKQLPDTDSIYWIFLQTLIQEVSGLIGNIDIWGYLDFVFDYLDEFLFFGDFEGVFANYHFVHHDT